MERRRDNRGRILRTGESQRKDGLYEYKYTDLNGNRHSVYSWRLEKNDRTPAGKRRDLSLREKINQVQRDQLMGLVANGGNITVQELVDKYILTKTGVRESTKRGYKTVQNYLLKCGFAKRKINKITVSDAKIFLINMQKKEGKSYSTIHTVRGVLRPAFQMACDDDLIRKNPFSFELASIIVNDVKRRDAVSVQDERRFLEFIKNDKHYQQYYEGFYILFKTGMRISEFCGLTINDIDFEKRIIHVTHQLQRTADMRYIIEETKTDAGKRDLPMTEDVYQCFMSIAERRMNEIEGPEVDGYKGFLFLDKNGMPTVALHWEKYFQYALGKFNRTYKNELPLITPHVCRHTYITNMARKGMNPKQLQYLAGHSSITITMDYYTHLTADDARVEVERIEKECRKV